MFPDDTAPIDPRVIAEMRRRQRHVLRARKRFGRSLMYARNGLNGPRAVARRARQIAAGQLQVSL